MGGLGGFCVLKSVQMAPTDEYPLFTERISSPVLLKTITLDLSKSLWSTSVVRD